RVRLHQGAGVVHVLAVTERRVDEGRALGAGAHAAGHDRGAALPAQRLDVPEHRLAPGQPRAADLQADLVDEDLLGESYDIRGHLAVVEHVVGERRDFPGHGLTSGRYVGTDGGSAGHDVPFVVANWAARAGRRAKRWADERRAAR